MVLWKVDFGLGNISVSLNGDHVLPLHKNPTAETTIARREMMRRRKFLCVIATPSVEDLARAEHQGPDQCPNLVRRHVRSGRLVVIYSIHCALKIADRFCSRWSLT